MTPHSGHTTRFVRIDRTSSFQTLAALLRERILTGLLAPGAPLPNERELGDQEGLSRGSVREALRLLERDGLVATRPGRNGGSVVCRPGRDQVSHTLETFVRGQEIGLDSVLEVREAIEPALAAAAAENRTDADLDALAAAREQIVVSGPDWSALVLANSRWHWAVAEASHNPLLVAIAASLWDLLHSSNTARVVSQSVRLEVLEAHDGIAAAITARDPDAAKRRMLRHTRYYRAELRLLDRGLPQRATPVG